MNFIEVLEYLRQSPTNCVTHEQWLTKENKAIGFIGCFDKINIDQIHDIGDISKERFSNLNLMLSNRWLKLEDWHKSKKEHTELHTFEETILPSVKNEGIIGSNWTTGPKGFGPGLRAIFANPDNYLCNDCDRIQKECECPASIKEG